MLLYQRACTIRRGRVVVGAPGASCYSASSTLFTSPILKIRGGWMLNGDGRCPNPSQTSPNDPAGPRHTHSSTQLPIAIISSWEPGELESELWTTSVHQNYFSSSENWDGDVMSEHCLFLQSYQGCCPAYFPGDKHPSNALMIISCLTFSHASAKKGQKRILVYGTFSSIICLMKIACLYQTTQ